MKYDTLKALVNAKVYENTEQRITGGDMNTVLQSAIASLGAHYQMGGLVSPADQITVGDEPVVFLATTPGTYTYFGGIVVADGEVALLVWSGTAWSKQIPDIATRTEVSQLGQEVRDNKVTVSPGKNLYNPQTDSAGYFDANGALHNSSSYIVTNFIAVSQGTYHLSRKTDASINGQNVYINYYDTDKSYISSVAGGNTSLTVPSGVAYIRVTISTGLQEVQIERGNVRTVYEVFNPIGGYNVIMDIPDNSVSTPKLQDNTITTQKVQPGAIDSGRIASGTIGIEKIAFVDIGKNLFNPNDKDVLLGHYQTNSYKTSASASYNLSGYIPVEPNAVYRTSYNGSAYTARFVTLFGETMDVKSTYLENTNEINIPSDVFFIRLSIDSAHFDKFQVEKGSSITSYEAYSAKLKKSVLPSMDRYAAYSALGTNGDSASGALTANSALTLTNYPSFLKKKQNISFFANITTMGTLYIGKGYQYRSGKYIKIDGTNIRTVSCNLSGLETEGNAYAHGLIFSTFIKVVISVGDNGTAKVILQTLTGENTTITSPGWENAAGQIFVKSVDFVGTNVLLSTLNADVRKPLWIVGDSYLTVADVTRWPYYIKNFGFDGYLIDAISGGKSINGIYNIKPDLVKLFNFGTPKYLLYCLGMNDGSDTNSSTPSSDWLTAITDVLVTCSERSITPILATIPCTATINHEGKNAWVRASGYRYVDFAKAVNGQTFTSGTLNWFEGYNADGTHPTELGAQALATQVLVDFPEIMQYNP